MTPQIQHILKSRILILDGAMGTMIQGYKLSEEQYKGDRFKNAKMLQKGNNDLLTLSQPTIVEQIHREYLEAGADIIETNTFNSTSISMEDYGMQEFVREMNLEAAKIARKVADEFTNKNPNKPRYVAGSIGPTNKTTSMSARVDELMYHDIDFDDLCISYEEQIEALMDGGIDIILFETVFDTLNAKAGLVAAQNIFHKKGSEVPIILSLTLSDKAGITYSGQTIEEFLTSISHINLLSVGLNCSFGASDMKPHLKQLKKIFPQFVIAYPNAGLPNQLGEYDETPRKMASQIKEFVDEGLVNIVGGCCGTTPEHIAEFVKLVEGITPPTPSVASPYELTTIATVRNNSLKIQWDNFEAFKPNFIGRKVLNPIKIDDILPYINWKLFFPAWNLSAKFASVTNISMCGHCKAQWFATFKEEDREKAMDASKLYDDAQVLLQKIVDIEAEYIKAVFVIGEAYSENDTVYINNIPFAMLRQQKSSSNDEYLSLSDFVAPKSAGKKDYLGAFAVTAGAGADYLLSKYKNSGDEYSFSILQCLLHSLAEGATEWLHEQIRKKYWGYAGSEDLTIPGLFAVKYSGMRPTVGYSSIPDQSINFVLHNTLLKSEEIGITLSENGLMYPNATVSGFIFAHPEAKYFAVGKISEEQTKDYKQRRKMEPQLSNKFLANNI